MDKIRLDGGRPCLDFVNTIHDRFAAIAGRLSGARPGNTCEWCLRAGALSRHEADRAGASRGRG